MLKFPELDQFIIIDENNWQTWTGDEHTYDVILIESPFCLQIGKITSFHSHFSLPLKGDSFAHTEKGDKYLYTSVYIHWT